MVTRAHNTPDHTTITLASGSKELSLKMSGKVEEVKLKVSSNKVVVYSKTYCPYCTKAKSALANAGLKDYVLIELDEMDDGAEFQDALQKITGARSVSRVLFYGTSENSPILLFRSVI